MRDASLQDSTSKGSSSLKMSIKLKHKESSVRRRAGGSGSGLLSLLQARGEASSHTRPFLFFFFLQHFQNEASVPQEEEEEEVRDGGGRAGSLGGLEGEGELGPGLALAQDDFLLLLLLPLAVLLQLHALLVNLSLLLHDSQLLLGLGRDGRLRRGCVQSPDYGDNRRIILLSIKCL